MVNRSGSITLTTAEGGTDTLRGIEYIQFDDLLVEASWVVDVAYYSEVVYAYASYDQVASSGDDASYEYRISGWTKTGDTYEITGIYRSSDGAWIPAAEGNTS